MSPSFYIALRYLRSKKQTRFISVMTMMAILGVTVGVAALTITLSVMNGFEQEVRQRIIGADAHLKVQSFRTSGIEGPDSLRAQLLRFPNVEGAAPFVHARGLLKYQQQTEGIMLRGIDESLVSSVSRLPEQIQQGKMSLKRPESGTAGILLGNYLAEKIGVGVADTVYLVTTGGVMGLTPQLKRFVVCGIFSTGFFEYDNTVGYIDWREAAPLAGLSSGAIHGFELKISNYEDADRVAKSMHQLVRFPLFTMTWFEQNRTLFAWIKIEKWATFIVLSLIILVAMVNIISSLVMLVLEKGRDIGILKAMGATETGIARIFLLEGGLIGIIGTLLGSLLGYSFCWVQQTFGFFRLPGDVYFLDRLPIRTEWNDFVMVSLIALVLSLLAAWYPARRAARLDPVVAIRGIG